MKLFDLLNKNNRNATNDVNILYAPVSGKVLSLQDVNDGVFSSEALGKGCAILPNEEMIVAPCSGFIRCVANTKHSVAIESKSGIEVLIHVGLDTVELAGKGFKLHVSQNDKIKVGQKLLSYDKSFLESLGVSDITIITILNSDNYKEIKTINYDNVLKNDELLIVK